MNQLFSPSKLLKNTYLLAFFLFFFLFNANAQSLSISNIVSQNGSSTICSNQNLLISYSSSTQLGAGNKFTVQASKDYGTTWTEISSIDTASMIKTVIPTSMLVSSSSYYIIYLKITASSPKIESSYRSISLDSSPKVTISGVSKSSIVKGEIVNFTSNDGYWSLPTSLTTSDGNGYQDITNLNEAYLMPQKTDVYTIKQISNACGIGTITGDANITVKDFGISLIPPGSSYNSSVCIGNTVTLHVQRLGIEPAQSSYLVRLYQSSNSPSFTELPATLKDNLLSFTISDDVVPSYYNYIKILNASTKEEYIAGNVYLNIYAKPSVEVVTASKNVALGSTQNLDIQFSGFGPFNATLSDGQKLYNTSYSTTYTTQTVQVASLETKSYYITSFTTGCNTEKGEGKNKTVFTITPQNYIKTDSVKTGNYCPLQTAEVYYSSNVKLAVGTAVNVSLANYPNFNGYTVVVAGEVKDSKTVTFKIPSTVTPTLSNKNVYAMVSIPNYYSVGFTSTYFSINEWPSMIIYPTTTIRLSNPQSYTLNYNFSGGEPYTILFTDSTKLQLDKNSNAFNSTISRIINVTQNKTVAIQSVSNSCGRTNINGASGYSFVLASEASNSIEISSSTLAYGQKICEGQKVQLAIKTVGNFDSNTSYTVELLSSSTSTNGTILTTSKSKTIEITIPSSLSNQEYFIRVYSGNPFTYSNLLAITPLRKPEINSDYTNTSNLVLGSPLNLSSSISGALPITITYQDNSTTVYDLINSVSAYYSSVSKTLFPSQSGIFGIKSLSNLCGLTNSTSAGTNVTVVPYTITASYGGAYGGSSSICADSKISVSYTTQGLVPDTTTFRVEAAKSNNGNLVYQKLQSEIKLGSFIFTIPNTFDEGYYYFRITNGKGDVVSNAFYIGVIKKPNVSIWTSNNTKEISIDYGSSTYIALKTGNTNSSINLLMQDNGIKFIKRNVYSSISISKYPKVTTVYKLTGATGQCGIETFNDSVKVVVKPLLKASYAGTNTTPNILCQDKPLSLNINALGQYEADNKFQVSLVSTSTGTVITKLTSNAVNGYNTIPIPQSLAKGSYNVLIESSNPVGSYTLNNCIYTSKPDISISGINGQIILQGDGVTATFKDNKAISSSTQFYNDLITDILLSDSTKASLSYWNGGNYSYALYPKVTTTYTIKSVSNSCGIGVSSGSLKVIVSPRASRSIGIQGFVKTKYTYPYTSYDYQTSLCKGSTYEVAFYPSGTFSASNLFTVQMSDINGENFKNLESTKTGTNNLLKVTLPSTLDANGKYLFRVVASDTGSVSTTTRFIHLISEPLTARFETDSYLYEKDKTLDLKIKFSGTPPFYFTLGKNEIEANLIQPFKSEDSLHTFKYTPDANTTIRLFSVSNALCGTGIINNPSSVRLELITGIEELNALGIKLYPNPTSDKITIESDTKPMQLRLVDAMGTVLKELMIRDEKKEISLSDYPTGLYFLHINKEDKTASFKILKL